MVFVAVQGSQERKRRRQLRASIFALALPLSLGPGWVLWATVPKASGPIQGPQRKLLESLLQVRLSQLAGRGDDTGECRSLPSSWSQQMPQMCAWECEGGAGLGCVLVGRNLLKSKKGWVWDAWWSPRGTECITSSHRTILKSWATCWVASQPLAPGRPGSPHSPES